MKAFGGVNVQLQKNNGKIINIILQDYLNKIFAFALRRTYNRGDAEDLAQDIVLEIISSSWNLKNEQALKGWVWAIARNTYMRWLRKHKDQLIEYSEAKDEFYIGSSDNFIEQNLIANEELCLLRREIGLLSGVYRDIIVLYYFKDKGCAEIARLMDISEGMVKYYLFKARKTLKEGMNMVRNLGEKSYDPGELSFGFWGEFGGEYFKLFKRKLPGSLLLASYEKPVNIEELSVETGVPLPYLEDEIQILIEHGLLEEMKNKTFQTSFIIIKKDLNNRIDSILDEKGKQLAGKIHESLSMYEDIIRRINFTGSEYEWSKLLWILIPLIFKYALVDRLQTEIMPPLPLLKTGIRGWPNASEKKYTPWSWGGYNIDDDEGNRFSTIDFQILQRYCFDMLNASGVNLLSKLVGSGRLVDEISEEEKVEYARLIENGFARKEDSRIVSEIVIFTHEQYIKLQNAITSQVDYIYEEGKVLLLEVENILKGGVSIRLQDQIRPHAYIAFLGWVIGHIMESLAGMGYITVPEGRSRASVANIIICK